MHRVDKLRTAQKAKDGIKTNPPAAKPLKAKGKAKKKWTPPTAEQRDVKLQGRGRLPDESKIDAKWNAKKGQWTVCLRIGPFNDPKMVAFLADGTGLFKTLEAADDQYRAWLELHKDG